MHTAHLPFAMYAPIDCGTTSIAYCGVVLMSRHTQLNKLNVIGVLSIYITYL